MTAAIYYASFYGATKQYADELATRLGTTAEEITEGSASAIRATDEPLIILSPIHGPSHPGVKVVKEVGQEGVEKRKVALVTVGMTLDHVVEAQDPARALLGDLAGHVKRFYLPGRLNYSELSSKPRNIMKGLITMLKLKPGKTENERMMIDTYGKDTDRVDLDRLDAIVEWVKK